MKTKFFFTFLLPVVIFIAACKDTINDVPELTGISLSQSTMSLAIGDSLGLIVNYEPRDAREGAPKVTWESTRESVAIVSSEGMVTGVNIGTATIIATCGKFSAECKVEVSKDGTVPVNPNDSSTTPKDSTVTPPVGTDYLSLSTFLLHVDGTGGICTVRVQTNLSWTATCNKSWVTLSPASGNGSQEMTLTVDFNHGNYSDDANVTVKAGNFSDSVIVIRGVLSQEQKTTFSAGEDSKIYFAPANLQYKPSTKSWRFAEHAYDVIGMDNTNISNTYDGWLDLLPGGSGENPTLTITVASYYKPYVDWDIHYSSISGGYGHYWRSPTYEEMSYIIKERKNANKLYGLATVNNVAGLIILPDYWAAPEGITFVSAENGFDGYNKNVYTVAQWEKMLANGAAFLPCGGSRLGNSVSESVVQGSGNYWTSTPSPYNDDYLYYLEIKGHNVSTYSNIYPFYGHCVRLIRKIGEESPYPPVIN